MEEREKKTITDEEITNYCNGCLTTDEERDLESRILKTGQTDMLMHVMIAYYETNSCDDVLNDTIKATTTEKKKETIEKLIPDKEQNTDKY